MKFFTTTGFALAAILLAAEPGAGAEAPAYRLQLDVITKGYDGEKFWCHPRAGVIPGSKPAVVLTMQRALTTGSDIFYALNEMRTDDLGKKWSGPWEHGETLGRRNESNGVVVAACDFWPKWHAKSKKLLGIGHTVRYLNNKVMPVRNRETSYAVYDEKKRTWSPWTTLAMPESPEFLNAGAGCAQRVDLPNGDILLPIYFKRPKGTNYQVTVLRCGFNGEKLEFKEHGNKLALDTGRGLYEPSLARLGSQYFLTLRNDHAGYVATSKDGLNFAPPQIWRFDDGTELGNYNTQQHWVTHRDGLFLVYTRKGANNDHVFRHRAPLFMAQVDPKKLRVIRATERIIVPERGARLGNFGVTDVSENETWVTVAEWMQTWGPDFIIPPDNKYGANNSVYAARIIWDKPNRDWNDH